MRSADAVFEICGAKISLETDHPQEAVVVHSIPEDYQALSKQRAEKKSCDVTLIIGDKECHGHKAVLIARSKFFSALFESSMNESTTGIVNLSSKFCDFDTSIIDSLLDYVYTGIITISVDNVQDVMMGAVYLQIESVMDECGRFMRKRMSIDNVLQLQMFFKSISYNKFDDCLLKFIDKNFVSISGTAEFLEMSIDDLVDILDRDSLYVDGEEQVFDAVCRWIGVNEARKADAARLLKRVRCTLFSDAFIRDTCEQTDWVVNGVDCIALLNEAKEYNKNKTSCTFKTRNRVCDDAHRLIVLLGTCANSEHSEEDDLELYDPIADTWTKANNLKKTKGTSIAVIDRKLYIYGSFRDNPHHAMASYYDTVLDKWFPMPNHDPRYGKSSCVFGRKIYVVGGCDGTNALSRLEVYDPSTQVWSTLASMSKPRKRMETHTLNGKLYVIGGLDNDWHVLTDGECYDPETDSWSPIAPMKYERWGFATSALNGKIYVTGGIENRTIVNYVERYDPVTDTWTTLNGMKRARAQHAMIVSCGKIFVLDGTDSMYDILGGNYYKLSSVEVYHPEGGDYWEERAPMSNAKDCFVFPFAIPATLPSPASNLEGTFHPIHSSGFQSFMLKDELLRALSDNGFKYPSETQHEYIPRAMRGMNFICQARPGVGKTTTFVLATLHQLSLTTGKVSVLVLCHSQEQAYHLSEEYDKFSQYLSVKKAVFCGDRRIRKNRNILKHECPQIVIGTSERILSLARCGVLSLKQIKRIVIDECDKIMNNNDMLRDVENIFKRAKQNEQVMLFSSVLDKNLCNVCEEFIK